MTKGRAERRRLRLIERGSVMDKRFKRIAKSSKQITSRKVFPSVVVSDLRRGSLVSLDRYLAREGGIDDRAIAIGWGYYFKVGVTLTIPVLLVTLGALALRISLA